MGIEQRLNNRLTTNTRNLELRNYYLNKDLTKSIIYDQTANCDEKRDTKKKH